MAHPIPHKAISTRYGVPGRMWAAGHHTGVDVAAPEGTEVHAVAPGLVVHSGTGGWGRAYGSHIVVHIDDTDLMVGYMHLSWRYVVSGRRVEAGDIIGKVGSTGNVTGPHLHLEARKPPHRYGDDVFPGFETAYLAKLKFGQKHSDSVRVLQAALNAHHLDHGRQLPVTGTYGPLTDAEVRKCQAQHGYGPARGHADPKHQSNVGPSQAAHLGLLDVRI